MLKKVIPIGAFVAALGFLAVFSIPAHKVLAQNGGVQCQQQTLSVHLSETDPVTYHVVGWLCAKGSPQHKTVQVVISGGTYDHTYWDFPYQPQTYSYLKKAVDDGYAVFNFDRLGTGLSDHPPSLQMTVQASVFMTHQVVQALRAGSVGNISFSKVITIGHSFGSGIALLEASAYADVDGVVLTGLLHQFNEVGLAVVVASFYPAGLDPKFATASWAPGYFTSIPGTRGGDFYNTAFADPAVIALDETLKGTDTYIELTDSQSSSPPEVSQQIHVPVLLAIGEKDIAFCNETIGLSCANSGAVLAREQSAYSPQACLEAVVQPLAGHSIALHPNTPATNQAILDWADRRVGNQQPPTQPCQ